MKFVLVRHGATEWSVSGQHTGLTDIELTIDGRDQAARAGQALRILMGDAMDTTPVFSSPLQRARHTATIVFGHERTISISEDLVEFNYGDFEGLTTPEIRAGHSNWDLWRDGCPGGETCIDVGLRADRFLAQAEAASDTVIVVAHGHLLRILAARAIGLDPHEGRAFTLDTATVSIIEDVRGYRLVKLWNLDPHLLGN
jgi:broad specificity phosphatase PhoE